MWQVLETPFGNFRTYTVCICIGTLFALIAAMIVNYVNTRKIKESIIGLVIGGLLMAISYPGKVLNTLNYMDFTDVKDFFERVIVSPTGNHFLGRVLLIGIVLPVLYKLVLKNSERTQALLDGAGIMLVVQHIFNRIGCLCNGCCYGKPYSGIFAVRYPKEVVGYDVYPSQLIEIFFMILILCIGLVYLKKKKHIFSRLLIGFGFGIFISEFFYVQTGNVLIAGLNVIQYASIVLVIVGIYREKRVYGREKSGAKQISK